MLIDSNILIYAINSSSPKNQQAQTFLERNLGTLEVAHQNIFETLRVLTHPKFSNPMDIMKAISSLEGIIQACSIITPTYITHQVTLELIKKYKLTSDKIFDAYLVATTMSNDIKTIATDNVRDIQKFEEIKVINPFT